MYKNNVNLFWWVGGLPTVFYLSPDSLIKDNVYRRYLNGPLQNFQYSVEYIFDVSNAADPSCSHWWP